MNTQSHYIDELSGVYNRRYLKEKQEAEIATYIEHNIPFSVVMIDIDHFKEINDTHGHLKGDEIIKGFARFLQEALRRSDSVIRYGGDEFMCVMPKAMRQDAEWIYRRILKQCKEHTFSELTISLSIGIASFPDDGGDFAQLMKIADEALYDAKRSGRGRIGVIKKKKIELPMKIFLDRIEEKEAMRRVLSDGKQVQVVTIKGNVGVGKTRLGKEVLGACKGQEIIWSDCIFMSDSIAYYPIREALNYRVNRLGIALLQDLPSVYKLELGKLIPEIAEELEEPEGIDVVMDKYRLYESIRKVVEIGNIPKVFVIDNVQWIDKESIEVLRYLVRTLKEQIITFVFIFRTEEMTDFLEDFFTSVSRETSVVDIPVEPLTVSDAKKGMQAIIGEEPNDSLVNFVYRESGGVPFYVEEIMRGLVEKRYLTVEHDTWVFRVPEEEIVPKSLEDVAMRKYRSLSKEAQQVLDIASTIGRFDIDIIMHITGYNEGEIMGLINDISRLGMVRYTQDRFEFADEISRNALYKRNIEGIRGITLHRQVAEQLEVSSKGKEKEMVEELALHFYRGKAREKGIRYCAEAGDSSRQKYANQEAIRYYTWALALMKDETDEQSRKTKIDYLLKRSDILNVIGDGDSALRDLKRCLLEAQTMGARGQEAAIMHQQAKVYFRLSQYHDAIQAAEKCQNISEEIGERNRYAESLRIIGNAHTLLGDIEKARNFYEQALTIFKETKERRGEQEALNNIGVVYKKLGNYSRALEYYEKALQIAQDIGYKPAIGSCFANIGGVYHLLGNYHMALKYYEDSLQIDREMGDRRSEALTSSNLGVVYEKLGKSQNALDYHEASLRMKREIGDKRGEAISLSNTSLIHIKLGQYEKAVTYFENALEITREIGEKSVEAFTLNGLGNAYQDLGEFQKALHLYEEALKIVEQIHIDWQRFDILLALGKLHNEMREWDKAHRCADEVCRMADEANSQPMIIDSLSLRAELYIEQGKLNECADVIHRLEDITKNVTNEDIKAGLYLVTGRYYAAHGDSEQADSRLHASLMLYESLGDWMATGRAHYYIGVSESTKGRKSQCADSLKKALDIFRFIKSKAWIEKAEAAMKMCTS
jgi:diguanylate cyclase (GGDEF)-like protein